MRGFFMNTARLGFSVWNEKDINDALELWGNSKVTEFIVMEGKMSKEQVSQRLKKEIESYNSHNIQYWPVFLRENNQNIGCCGLRPYDS